MYYYNKGVVHYKYYGERGISYDPRWEKFENFYADMGDRPAGMTIDRIDNNKGYSKENCRWATLKEQANNTSRNHKIKFQGKTQTLTQWAEEVGINRRTIGARLKLGWSVERTLTSPVRRKASVN